MGSYGSGLQDRSPVDAAAALEDLVNIDCLLAGNVDALEGHLRGSERLGRVQPHLGADTVAVGRVELGTLALRHDDEVAVSLEARRHRPFNLGGIVDVD